MTDAKEPESVRALRRIRELYADVDAWVTWADDGQPLEAYAGELLDYIDTLTRERDEARRNAARLAKQGRHIIAEFKKLRGDTMDVECVLALAGLDRMLDARTVTLNGGRRYGKADAARTADLTQGDA
jgi:hypothetical protein